MTIANIALIIDTQNGFGKKDIMPEKGGSLYVGGGEEVAEPTARLLGHVSRTADAWSVILSQDWHPKDHISFASNHKGLDLFSGFYIQSEGDKVRVVGVKKGDNILAVDTDKHGHIAKIHDDRFLKALPPGTIEQVAWTNHCEQGTESAEFLARVMLALPQGLVWDLTNQSLNNKHLLEIRNRQGHSIAVVRKGYDRRYDSYSLVKDNGGMTETPATEHFKKLAAELGARGVKAVNIVFNGLATDYCVDFSYQDTRAVLPALLRQNGIEEVKWYFLPEASRGIAPEGCQAALKRMAAAGVEQTTVQDIISASATKRPLVGHPLLVPTV